VGPVDVLFLDSGMSDVSSFDFFSRPFKKCLVVPLPERRHVPSARGLISRKINLMRKVELGRPTGE
jgi:hypothetical protein